MAGTHGTSGKDVGQRHLGNFETELEAAEAVFFWIIGITTNPPTPQPCEAGPRQARGGGDAAQEEALQAGSRCAHENPVRCFPQYLTAHPPCVSGGADLRTSEPQPATVPAACRRSLLSSAGETDWRARRREPFRHTCVAFFGGDRDGRARCVAGRVRGGRDAAMPDPGSRCYL